MVGRFFELTRNGNEFRKTALNEFNADWVWRDLQRLAESRADIIDMKNALLARTRANTC